MGEVYIKNNFIKEKICYKLKKDIHEKINEDDLKKIKDILLNGIDINSRVIDYSYEDFQILNHLETISVCNFIIDDEMIEKVNFLTNLKKIEFNNCSFNSTNNIILNIKEIIVTNCENFSSLQFKNASEVEKLKMIYCENINIDDILGFINVNEMYLCNSNLKNFIKIQEFNKLKRLKLDGSKLDNDEIISKIANSVEISHEKIFLYTN